MQLGFERIFQVEEARGLPKGTVWAKQMGCTHGDSCHARRGLTVWVGAGETALDRSQATSPRQLQLPAGPLCPLSFLNTVCSGPELVVRGKARPTAGSLFPTEPSRAVRRKPAVS